MDEHPKSTLDVTEADRKKVTKIHGKMIAAFSDAIDKLNKLGSDRFAVHNFGVHVMLHSAAHAAAWNAMREGREPRPDFWETVARDAMEKAKKELSGRLIEGVWRVVVQHDPEKGEWNIISKDRDARPEV